jgi:hypothetical protein
MRYGRQSGQRKPGRGETRAPQFLIANLELESQVSPIRISNLNFSNRKFLSIFAAKFCAHGEPPAAFFSPQPPTSNPQSLIVTPRLEFLATRTKQTPNQNPNRYKSRFSRRGCTRRMPVAPLAPHLPEVSTSHELQVTSHESRLSRLLHRAPATPNMASRNPSTKEFC